MSKPSNLLPDAIHIPFQGSTIDTSPQALGLADDSSQDQQKDPGTSPKARVKRAVGKTVDKLGRSISGKYPSSTSQSPPASTPTHKFSLSRKGKGKERATDSEHLNLPIYAFHQLTSLRHPIYHKRVYPSKVSPCDTPER